jgi:hypothetical protein
MTHFVNTLLNYLLTAIEEHWTAFLKDLETASSFEQAIALHEALLSRVLSSVMLNSACVPVYNHLCQILQVIQKFRANQESLNINLSI